MLCAEDMATRRQGHIDVAGCPDKTNWALALICTITAVLGVLAKRIPKLNPVARLHLNALTTLIKLMRLHTPEDFQVVISFLQ